MPDLMNNSSLHLLIVDSNSYTQFFCLDRGGLGHEESDFP